MTQETTQAQNADAPKLGTPEYDAAMAAKFDASQDPETFDNAQGSDILVPTMPEGGSEKFYDAKTGAYDWQSHAKEAEFKLAQKGPKADAEADTDPDKAAKSGGEDADAEADKTDADEAVADVVKAAGLDVNELRDEIVKTGEINADAKEKLVKAGIPEALVDDYVSLAKDAITRNQTDAFEYAGGEETWNSLATWASENLPEAEVTKYNEMLAGADWKVAIDTLKTKMGSARPTAGEGELRGANAATGGTVAAFQTREEMSAAINKLDPTTGKRLYETDPAYRAQVAQRITLMQ